MTYMTRTKTLFNTVADNYILIKILRNFIIFFIDLIKIYTKTADEHYKQEKKSYVVRLLSCCYNT